MEGEFAGEGSLGGGGGERFGGPGLFHALVSSFSPSLALLSHLGDKENSRVLFRSIAIRSFNADIIGVEGDKRGTVADSLR